MGESKIPEALEDTHGGRVRSICAALFQPALLLILVAAIFRHAGDRIWQTLFLFRVLPFSIGQEQLLDCEEKLHLALCF